ncbi:hypothetical protein LCGC14_0311330 [marine sediment metagenome]|uniref:Uncharacterized protein n=1 Tax=marine sediment metagenome TaxID=412755 RepID=A0A0F9TMG7_9ZZZZ
MSNESFERTVTFLMFLILTMQFAIFLAIKGS